MKENKYEGTQDEKEAPHNVLVVGGGNQKKGRQNVTINENE